MSTPAPDPKDPRFRSFRGAAWAVYLTFAVGFSSVIIYSVFKSVLAMSPERPNTAEVISEGECLREARVLFSELEQYRKDATISPDVAHADERFLKFRIPWLTRKRGLEAKCALDSRANLKAAFGSLEHVLDLYTTNTVQFASGVGPTIDALKLQLEGH
ncbi:MAG: hypothetical protein ACO1OB_03130 [Archangium sp.]